MLTNDVFKQAQKKFNVVFSEGDLERQYYSAVQSAANDAIAISYGDDVYDRTGHLFDTIIKQNIMMQDVVEAIENNVSSVDELGDFSEFDRILASALEKYQDAVRKDFNEHNRSVETIECIVAETVDEFLAPIRNGDTNDRMWDSNMMRWENSDECLSLAMAMDDCFSYQM